MNELADALVELRSEADVLDFGMRDPNRRECVRGGFLLALELVESRLRTGTPSAALRGAKRSLPGVRPTHRTTRPLAGRLGRRHARRIAGSSRA